MKPDFNDYLGKIIIKRKEDDCAVIEKMFNDARQEQITWAKTMEIYRQKFHDEEDMMMKTGNAIY